MVVSCGCKETKCDGTFFSTGIACGSVYRHAEFQNKVDHTNIDRLDDSCESFESSL